MMSENKVRIAIADDHPIFLDGLCRLLSMEQDFEVVAQVSDGLQVLDILQACEPDVLLLDLNMPGLNGLATLDRLRSANLKTRVILLTASDNQNEFMQALKLGSWGIVMKQLATELLVESIRRVHSGELWMDGRTTAEMIKRFSGGESAPPPEPAPRRAKERPLLSPREREIVSLTAQGFKNGDMAAKLGLSEQTIKNHLHSIFEKLEVTDRLEMVLHAVSSRLVGVASAG